MLEPGWRYRARVVARTAAWALRPGTPAVPEAPGPVRVDGFGSATVTVTGAAGSRELTVLVAATVDAIERGMQGRTCFAGHDAMLFVAPSPCAVPVHMARTPLPLDVALFDDTGVAVQVAHLAPGGDDVVHLLVPEQAWRFMLEAPLGSLAGFGVATGSVLEPASLRSR